MSDIRNAGLDVVRSTAICLVLLAHGASFFLASSYDVNGFAYVTGYLGVEIFFVLSGFLIGRIIITHVYATGSWSSLRLFYLRRWFRTLPLYYLMVIVLLLWGNPFTWQNLIFIQNFQEQMLNFMPVSWSLTIEEWFYLIIPIIFLVFAKLRVDKRLLFFLLCGCIIVLELCLRIYHVTVSNPDWDYGVRKQIYLRMDSLMIGVLLAGLQMYFRNIYKWITSSTTVRILTLIGFVAFAGYFVYTATLRQTMDHSFFGRTFLFTLISIFCAVFVAVLEANPWVNTVFANKWIAKVFQFVSVTSYATYLIHFDIFWRLGASFRPATPVSGYEVWALAQAIVTVIAYLLYRFYERPMMNIREKFSKAWRDRTRQTEVSIESL